MASAKHIATIRARLRFQGTSIFTEYSISKRSDYYFAVKHKKNGDYNLLVFEKASSRERKKR